MPKRTMDGMGRMGAETAEIEFTLPAGIVLEGDSGESVIAWKKTPDGTIRVVSIDGNSVGADAEPEEAAAEGAIDAMDGMEGMAS